MFSGKVSGPLKFRIYAILPSQHSMWCSVCISSDNVWFIKLSWVLKWHWSKIIDTDTIMPHISSQYFVSLQHASPSLLSAEPKSSMSKFKWTKLFLTEILCSMDSVSSKMLPFNLIFALLEIYLIQHANIFSSSFVCSSRL